MAGNMKNQIAQCYMELVLKKDIDKITVTDLVQKMGVSRQTFYYHFQDLLDVVEWVADQSVQQALSRSMQAASLEEALKIFIEAAAQKHQLIARLLQSQRRDHLERVFTAALEEYLSGVLRRHGGIYTDAGEKGQIARAFCVYGVVGVLLSRCGRADMDPEKLASQLARLLCSQSLS